MWLPRNVPHTFRVDSEQVRLLELITPAGFERFHIDASDAARTLELPPLSEPDIPRLVGAIGEYDAEIIGPPRGPGDLSAEPGRDGAGATTGAGPIL